MSVNWWCCFINLYFQYILLHQLFQCKYFELHVPVSSKNTRFLLTKIKIRLFQIALKTRKHHFAPTFLFFPRCLKTQDPHWNQALCTRHHWQSFAPTYFPTPPSRWKITKLDFFKTPFLHKKRFSYFCQYLIKMMAVYFFPFWTYDIWTRVAHVCSRRPKFLLRRDLTFYILNFWTPVAQVCLRRSTFLLRRDRVGMLTTRHGWCNL